MSPHFKTIIQSISLATLLLICAAFLSGCGVSPALVGEKAREAEEALCPLQTARNLDNTLDNILSLVPLIAWEPVCTGS